MTRSTEARPSTSPPATRGLEAVRIDDPTLRTLARVSLAVYARAGFTTADLLDALPATAFVDLVHANAEGTRRFTGQVADIAIAALQHVPRVRP